MAESIVHSGGDIFDKWADEGAAERAKRVNDEPSGRAMLDGGQCQCGDAIRPGDIVAANFDSKRVHTGGGLYLVQSPDGWHGCRRMTRVPDGIAIDQDGYGDWVTVRDMDATCWRVVGTVETVYRPTRYQ